jgi:hypothetical protein
MMRWMATWLVALSACSSILQIDDTPSRECNTDVDCRSYRFPRSCSMRVFQCVTVAPVMNADDELYERESPHLDSLHLQSTIPNGTLVSVVCQTRHGDQSRGHLERTTGNPFTTWDLLDDGYWVYDWYVNTQTVVNGYSDGIDPCPGD